jgi:hypothetical protein
MLGPETYRPFIHWKVRYRDHNSQSLGPIISQINAVETLPRNILKVHSHINHTLTHRRSMCPQPFRFLNQNIVRISCLLNT